MPESEWRRIDARFEEVTSQLQLNVHLILTDQPAYVLGHQTYVYLEPLGHIVMTLNYAESEAVIWTDPSCWHDGWVTIFDDVEKLLQQGRLVDALLCALNAAYAYAAGKSRPSG